MFRSLTTRTNIISRIKTLPTLTTSKRYLATEHKPAEHKEHTNTNTHEHKHEHSDDPTEDIHVHEPGIWYKRSAIFFGK
jgi:ABC-type Zn2+ transport system substrate-binding protein/surface adhesin